MGSVWKVVKNLSVNLTWKMLRGLLSKPFLLPPTIWATVESVVISERFFNESSSGRGVANAFRHAVWNLLIAKNSSYFTSESNAVSWAKFITDLHEECFPNEPFDHKMDLHNNKYGRDKFQSFRKKNIKTKRKMVELLFACCESSVGLEKLKDIDGAKNRLVYFKNSQ